MSTVDTSEMIQLEERRQWYFQAIIVVNSH